MLIRDRQEKMRNVIVVAVCLFGITSWYFNMDFETVGSYPIRVYAQELSEDNEIDLRENSKFTLRKTKTPLGLGYELYSLVEKVILVKLLMISEMKEKILFLQMRIIFIGFRIIGKNMM